MHWRNNGNLLKISIYNTKTTLKAHLFKTVFHSLFSKSIADSALILIYYQFLEAATGNVQQKTLFLKILQYSQENPCIGVFSCEYCKMFKNTFFEKHLRTATSVFSLTWLRIQNSFSSRSYYVR